MRIFPASITKRGGALETYPNPLSPLTALMEAARHGVSGFFEAEQLHREPHLHASHRSACYQTYRLPPIRRTRVIGMSTASGTGS